MTPAASPGPCQRHKVLALALWSHAHHQRQQTFDLENGTIVHQYIRLACSRHCKTIRSCSSAIRRHSSRKLVFKKPRPTIGFLGRKPVPIAVKWTSTSVPEFSNVL